MQVLIIYCHPSANSFTAAVKDAFIKGLQDGNHQYEFRCFMTENPDDCEYYLTVENNNTGNIERYYSNYESGRCLFKITLKEYNDYTLSALIVDKETKDERSVPLVMISVGNNSFTERVVSRVLRKFGLQTLI